MDSPEPGIQFSSLVFVCCKTITDLPASKPTDTRRQAMHDRKNRIVLGAMTVRFDFECEKLYILVNFVRLKAP